MHRLDSYIQDIEPRICAICCKASQASELAEELPAALTSYGWILLDSWVAWRTLRYLLRDTHISENVHEKWFKTPSSYNLSQLKAIWGFEKNVEEYVEKNTGNKLKELFNEQIQKKRNASAHFSMADGSNPRGDDHDTIKRIFNVLSKVFLFYEVGSFIRSISLRLCRAGYTNFRVQFNLDPDVSSDVSSIEADYFFEHIEEFVVGLKDRCDDDKKKNQGGSHKEKTLIYLFSRHNDDYTIKFHVEGCSVGKKKANGDIKYRFIRSEKIKKYVIFENKGYYTDIDSFVRAVLEAIE